MPSTSDWILRLSRCAACLKDNPAGFRFCGFCGALLLADPRRTEERRLVTVLFCDLVGFTARSDRADPEDVRAMLLPYHSRLKQEIEAFGGTLDKFLGDGAMGVFGAPTAHEDDPERAVRAAIAIQEAMRELEAERPGRDLAARVGITTGEAVVAFGTGPQVGESVTGDIVNTASRIQAVAPPSGILVGERTYLATRDRIDYETLEPVTVKGKAEPIPLWRVIGARGLMGADPDRAHRSEFVGRQAERDLLEEIFRRAVTRRSAQLVTIVGAPGVGKSRLVAELHRTAASRPGVKWRHGRCLPYGEGVTFWAIEELVKAELGILESDPPDQRAGKLDAALGRMIEEASERAWLRARVGALIGLEGSPGAEREESFAAWHRFFDAVVSSGPLVAVVEDLHWGDPAVLAFLEGLLERVPAGPLMIVATTRPELLDEQPTWGARIANATTIGLAPLSEGETGRLIHALLGDAALPEDAHAQLVERAGGNPLYAEEITRMLSDAGVLDEQGRPTAELSALSFPDSVQALIAARLDTLAPDRRGLIQDAAVIGHVFWSGAAAALGNRGDAATVGELDALARREFVRVMSTSTFAGQAEYSFWHALVRDVAYAQIPRVARSAKHRAAAGWIEAMAGDRSADLAEVLVFHARTALDLARAAGKADDMTDLEDMTRRFSKMAGAHSMALDVARAERHLRRALDLTPPEHPDRPGIEARLGEAAFQAGRHEEAEQLFASAVDGLNSLGLPKQAADAMIRLSVVVEYRGDPRQGRAILTESIRILEGLPPGPELARALAESAGTLMVSERYAEVVSEADRAIELAQRVEEPEAAARAHNFRGYSRVALGDLEGMQELRRSVETALGLGLGRTTAVAYSNLGAALLMAEGPRASLECGRAGLAFAEARGLLEMASFLRNGMLTALTALGEWDEVLRAGAEVAADARRGGAEYEEVYALLDQSYVLLMRGDPGSAGVAERLLARARPLDDPPLLAWAMTSAALGRLGSGDPEGAAALVAEAIDITQGDAITTRATALVDLMQVAIATGDLHLAERALEGVDRLPLPRHRHAFLSARAAMTEAKGGLTEALLLYENAATQWERFGQALDRGQALLGAGRCLATLGRAEEARERLVAAREVFARLGAKPLVAEAGSWLERASGAGSIAP